MVRPEDIVGAWRLEAFDDVDDSGAVASGPLGPRPTGFLLYLPSRYMSVSMMRTSPGTPHFMGYAGRWWVHGDHLVHDIAASSRSDWVGTQQARCVDLDGDQLHISAVASEPRDRQRSVVRWRRIPVDH